MAFRKGVNISDEILAQVGAASIDDAGDYFTTDTVNGATQQLGGEVDGLQTQIIEKTSYGVITGLVTEQQTVADMTVKVSAGTIYMLNGDRFTPPATASLAVTAADATNPRIDIIYVSSAGVVSYLAGTAGASPAEPSTPAGGELLAAILVVAGRTSITAAYISRRYRTLWTGGWNTPTLINSWEVTDASTLGPVRFRKMVNGHVRLAGFIGVGVAGSIAFVLPSGFRPPYTVTFACASSGTNPAGKVLIDASGNVTVSILYGVIALSGIEFPTS